MVVDGFNFAEELFDKGGFLLGLLDFFVFIFRVFGILDFLIGLIHVGSSFLDLEVGEFDRVLQTFVDDFGEGLMVFEILFEGFFFEMGTK